MGGKWPYSCCFVGCCFQDLVNIAPNILVQFPTSFSSMNFVIIHVVHLYSSIDTTTAWKKSNLTLLDRSDFYMIDSLSIAGAYWHHFQMRHCCRSTWTCEQISEDHNLKHMYSMLFAFTWRLVPPAACSKWCSRNSARFGKALWHLHSLRPS